MLKSFVNESGDENNHQTRWSMWTRAPESWIIFSRKRKRHRLRRRLATYTQRNVRVHKLHQEIVCLSQRSKCSKRCHSIGVIFILKFIYFWLLTDSFVLAKVEKLSLDWRNTSCRTQTVERGQVVGDCFVVCGSALDRGSNLRWQVDSWPLDHQKSPFIEFWEPY